MPFPELHGESTEYVGRAEDAIIATSNYRLHIKFKESVVNVSIFEKRPMTLEVWCDERTFPTQLKVTKEWIPMSLLESVWKCVVMFCEWAELGGGGPLCQRCGDRAIQSRSALAAAPRDFSSPLFRHAPACALHFVSAPAVAVVAVVPEGTQNSRALSLSASPFTTLRKRAKRCYPRVVTF